MQSNISFGSSFHVSSSDNGNISSIYKLQRYCLDRDITSKTDETYSKTPVNGKKYQMDFRASVPDSMDYTIEDFCKTNGIRYRKTSFEDLMRPLRIMQRIEEPEKDMMKVFVNTKRLEELAKTQDSNIEHCKSDYNKYFKEDVDDMLKSGDKIPASTLWITPICGDKEDTIEYIETFGRDRLNENQISIMFTKETDEPDQCMYFGLKDNGMKEVPVYVNKDTFEIGSKLGLFS